jgi:hypothetical protein
LRALDAYEQALKVRNPRDTPFEYANTIANKANVIRNLPDDPDRAGLGRSAALSRARDLYREAQRIFESLGAADHAGVVGEALADIERELPGDPARRGNGNGTGDGSDHPHAVS